ncbi:hypothetical protein EDB81DRAFT_894780 [Dactylonectria macrodidyma]|uniref:Cyclin-like domain-containing protein n=1 Tax=Dactylonectria macrodidyma TaxID=307937 RepID=A0A9P9D0H9_9HYPO|nr:hypothetical protein EDB81DRAFT_894780 [Dactylonectria macrodidyma]
MLSALEYITIESSESQKPEPSMNMFEEYQDEIFDYQKTLERRRPRLQIPSRYLNTLRPSLAAAIAGASQDLGRPDTVFLAMDIADRFIAARHANPPPADSLGLLGGAALMIAAKYEGHGEDLDLGELANSVAAHYDQSYDRSAILSAERWVLSAIDYDLSWPGPLPFLERIIAENKSKTVVRFASRALLRRAVARQQFAHILPSMLAAVCYRLAQQDLTGQEWTKTHVRSSGYSEEELRPMLATLSQCVRWSLNLDE